ncbi:hypothetical protein MBLNU457_g0292t1 [Dothideomycetes sp. NU457]
MVIAYFHEFVNTTAVATQSGALSTTPSARAILTTVAPTPNAKTSGYNGSTSTQPSVTPSTTLPPLTLPPCCTLGILSGVGLNWWYHEPVTITVAVVTSVFHQYNNTKILATSTIKQYPNATAQYGRHTVNNGGEFNTDVLPYWFSIPGVPATLIPTHQTNYGATIFSNFDRLSWPGQSLTIHSPTSFVSFGASTHARYFSYWTGYQVGTTCLQFQRDDFQTTTVTHTLSAPLDGLHGGGEDGGGTDGWLHLNGSAAFPFNGDSSEWHSNTGVDQDGVIVNISMNVPLSLAALPAFYSQYPMLASCSFQSVGAGAPTVLIPATEMTAPVSITLTKAGNYVPQTSATTTQIDTQGGASSALNSPATDDTPTTDTGSAASSVLILMPSALSPTAVELIPNKATTQPLATSTPADISLVAANVPSLTESASQPSTADNDNTQISPSDTPNLGSIIAGVLGVTQAQPSPSPAALPSATVSPTSAQGQGLNDQPVSSADVVSPQSQPVPAVTSSPSDTQPGDAGINDITNTESAHYQADSTAIIGGTTVLIYNTDSEDGPQPTKALIGLPASQAGAQEIQQSTQFTTTINGSPTTMPFVPDISATAPEAQSSPTDLALPVQAEAPSLSTAALNGVLTTFLAMPVPPPNTEAQSPSSAPAAPAQTGAAQPQPQPMFAVIGGTTMSFLAATPTGTAIEGASGQGQGGQQQQPVPITALVSGSLVTSWAVPLPSAGSAETLSTEDETQQQLEANLAVMDGTTVSFLTAPPSSTESESASEQDQGGQQRPAVPITALVSGSLVTSWAIPLPSAPPGNSPPTEDGTQQQSEPNLAVVSGTTFSILTAPPSTQSAGSQAQNPQLIPITALVSGSLVTSWAVPLPSATSGSSINSQTRLVVPQAQLITTTISGTAVTAWSIPPPTPNETPGGTAQTQPAAALISAIEGVVSLAATGESGSSVITTLRENPSSGSTGQLDTGASTARGSGSSVSTTQTGSSAQIRPAATSSTTSSAAGTKVPWGEALVAFFCLLPLAIL